MPCMDWVQVCPFGTRERHDDNEYQARLVTFCLFRTKRLLHLLRTLARTFRCRYVVCVLIVFLHRELKIKQLARHRKTFYEDLATQK